MKRNSMLVLFLLLAIILLAQTNHQKKSKEKRTVRNALVAERVDSFIVNRDFTFVAERASPMGWQPVVLTSNYDLKLWGDSVNVYLPYYGRAFQMNYNDTEGGIKLKSKLREYSLKKKKERYEISFEADSKYDRYRFHFSISESGYGSLSVNSNNRQTISFYGRLNVEVEN